ncbi:MAG: SPOR domain-containing protein [Lachnospiraceae bacterium]
MSNSGLIDCTVLSPNHSGKRTHSIDRITPHCVVGQLSAERIGACFPYGRGASCNYGVGYDGRQVLIVDEANRSWCTSSAENDQRAITIEVASDKTAPYTFTNEAYAGLVELCIDICKRNGKNKLIWFGDEGKTLSYNPKSNEMVLTVHRWFANKSCPGDWMYERMGQLANDVTNAISGGSSDDVVTKLPNDGTSLYRVQCGAFSKKSNAHNMLSDIKGKGVDAFITYVDGLYKVQVGAYGIKSNAEKQLSKMRNLGYDCFISTIAKESESFVPRKSAAEIAQEIFKGTCSDSRWTTWGTGSTRTERLTAAGYDPSAVQTEVNKLF